MINIFIIHNKNCNEISACAETPASATERIFFSDKEAIHMKDPAEIRFTWNAYNLTSNIEAKVHISLWGYRETKTRPEFEYITTLEVRINKYDRKDEKQQ